MKALIIFLLILPMGAIQAQEALSNEEKKLFLAINEYRKEKELPEVKLSKALVIVAQAHVRDLDKNYKRMKFFHRDINLHSWSGRGKWSKVLYYPDHRNSDGMWNKPSEIAGYKGKGYEISFMDSNGASADGALKGWKRSAGHNEVIIDKAIKWDCIGIAIYKDYACVWFGEDKDSEYLIVESK